MRGSYNLLEGGIIWCRRAGGGGAGWGSLLPPGGGSGALWCRRGGGSGALWCRQRQPPLLPPPPPPHPSRYATAYNPPYTHVTNFIISHSRCVIKFTISAFLVKKIKNNRKKTAKILGNLYIFAEKPFSSRLALPDFWMHSIVHFSHFVSSVESRIIFVATFWL